MTDLLKPYTEQTRQRGTWPPSRTANMASAQLKQQRPKILQSETISSKSTAEHFCLHNLKQHTCLLLHQIIRSVKVKTNIGTILVDRCDQLQTLKNSCNCTTMVSSKMLLGLVQTRAASATTFSIMQCQPCCSACYQTYESVAFAWALHSMLNFLEHMLLQMHSVTSHLSSWILSLDQQHHV